MTPYEENCFRHVDTALRGLAMTMVRYDFPQYPELPGVIEKTPFKLDFEDRTGCALGAEKGAVVFYGCFFDADMDVAQQVHLLLKLIGSMNKNRA